MDLNWRTLALALAAGLLGWALGDHNRTVREVNHPDPTRYHASLYSLHVRAVDSTTGEALAFDLFWDVDEVSPFGKGSGPGKIEEFPDGSKSVHLVGLPLAKGLILGIRADGYETGTVTVQGDTGGIGTDQPNDVMTVKLVKRSPAISAPGQPVQPASGRD